jgi:hypothetical protein
LEPFITAKKNKTLKVGGIARIASVVETIKNINSILFRRQPDGQILSPVLRRGHLFFSLINWDRCGNPWKP